MALTPNCHFDSGSREDLASLPRPLENARQRGVAPKEEVEGERCDKERVGLAAGRRCETGGRFEGTGR